MRGSQRAPRQSQRDTPQRFFASSWPSRDLGYSSRAMLSREVGGAQLDGSRALLGAAAQPSYHSNRPLPQRARHRMRAGEAQHSFYHDEGFPRGRDVMERQMGHTIVGSRTRTKPVNGEAHADANVFHGFGPALPVFVRQHPRSETGEGATDAGRGAGSKGAGGASRRQRRRPPHRAGLRSPLRGRVIHRRRRPIGGVLQHAGAYPGVVSVLRKPLPGGLECRLVFTAGGDLAPWLLVPAAVRPQLYLVDMHDDLPRLGRSIDSLFDENLAEREAFLWQAVGKQRMANGQWPFA